MPPLPKRESRGFFSGLSNKQTCAFIFSKKNSCRQALFVTVHLLNISLHKNYDDEKKRITGPARILQHFPQSCAFM